MTNSNDIAALRKMYRRLRTDALREFGYKMYSRTPITEEDEQEFDKTVKGLLVENNMELSPENYVDIARRMYNQARLMPYANE